MKSKLFDPGKSIDPYDPKTWRHPWVWKFWYKQRPDDLTLMLLKYRRDHVQKTKTQ